MLIHEDLTGRIIGAAMAVHREIGPGLLESAYEVCLCHELHSCGLAFRRQVPLPVLYKGVRLDCGYRIDVIVEDRVVVELKAIDAISDLHTAQLLTYLRMSQLRVGLLFNFNSEVLKDSMIRLVL